MQDEMNSIFTLSRLHSMFSHMKIIGVFLLPLVFVLFVVIGPLAQVAAGLQGASFLKYQTPLLILNPKTDEECDKLASEYQKLQQVIERDHSACLAAPQKGRGNASTPLLVDDASKCSRPECQELHNLRRDP